MERAAVDPQHLRGDRFAAAGRFEDALDVPVLDLFEGQELLQIVRLDDDGLVLVVADLRGEIVDGDPVEAGEAR